MRVHLFDDGFWAHEKRLSRFYLWREQHGKLHDVQARQCLTVERAIREAHLDGIDWLLHFDSDECLLVPPGWLSTTWKRYP